MRLKAELQNQCTCTVTPLPPKRLDQMTIQMRIDFCPLHARAAEYKAALEKIRDGGHGGQCAINWNRGALGCDCHVAIAEEALKEEGERNARMS